MWCVSVIESEFDGAMREKRFRVGINILDGKNPSTSYNINDMKNNEGDDYNTKGQHANDWSTRWEHAKSIIAPHHTFDMQLV